MTTTIAGELYAVVQWAQANGEVKALDRIVVFSLSALFKERISDLSTVTRETVVSIDCLQRVREAASKVVGKTCPC